MARKDELDDLRRAVISLVRDAESRAGETYSPHLARAKALLSDSSDADVTPVYWRAGNPPAPTTVQWRQNIDWPALAHAVFRWSSGLLGLIGAARALYRAYSELHP